MPTVPRIHKLEIRELLCKVSVATAEVATANVSVGEREDAQEEGEVAHDTAVCMYRWLREVCSTKLLQTPILLGGLGVNVQIDKSLFQHKP